MGGLLTCVQYFVPDDINAEVVDEVGNGIEVDRALALLALCPVG